MIGQYFKAERKRAGLSQALTPPFQCLKAPLPISRSHFSSPYMFKTPPIRSPIKSPITLGYGKEAKARVGSEIQGKNY